MSKTNKIAAVLLFFWLVLIFYMSAQTAEISGGNSTEIAETIAPVIVPGFSELSPPAQLDTIHHLDHWIRKAAHAAEYAILAILCMATYPGRSRKKAVFAWLFCVLYAASDEIHQLFVPGRAGMIQDVCIDSLGALFGVGLCALFYLLQSFLQKKHPSL